MAPAAPGRPQPETPPAAIAAIADGALAHALDTAIGRYTRTMRQALEQSDGAARLTFPQMRCLQALVREGPALTTQLARQLRIAAPTMTRMIDTLAERGLVERRDMPGDRRLVSIVITEPGRALLAHSERIILDHVTAGLASLTEAQKERLGAALQDLLAMLEAIHPDEN
jgi:DNA-binding MarR family transcriptional regulator